MNETLREKLTAVYKKFDRDVALVVPKYVYPEPIPWKCPTTDDSGCTHPITFRENPKGPVLHPPNGDTITFFALPDIGVFMCFENQDYFERAGLYVPAGGSAALEIKDNSLACSFDYWYTNDQDAYCGGGSTGNEGSDGGGEVGGGS